MSVEVLPARPIVSRKTLGPRFFFRWIFIGFVATLAGWYFMRSAIFTSSTFNLFIASGTVDPLVKDIENEISVRKLDGASSDLIPVNTDSFKSVLFWTTFFGAPDSRAGLGSKLFASCPVYQCIASGNWDQLATSDAVIFHALDIYPKNLPGHRRPGQHYIFLIGESPSNAAERIEKTPDNYFDITYTYRLDSSVLGHYMYSVPLIAPPKNFAEGKTKLAAWLVSNCKTPSRREDYVKSLQKVIPVDVYGKCGPLTCSRSEEGTCNDMLNKDYKFYLAFENSICQDYVTEKFTVALQNNVVPVVLGGGNMTIFPPKSYIHVDDFSSPTALGEYLQYLNKNDTAYNEYMAWRFDPLLIRSHGHFAPSNAGWCSLCEHLHDPMYQTTSYRDARKWFLDGGQCRTGHW